MLPTVLDHATAPAPRLHRRARAGDRPDRDHRSDSGHRRNSGERRDGRALANRLRTGADVRVVASRPFSSRVRRILLAAGARVRSAHRGPRRYHHDKFMAASFEREGRRQTRVWACSENWWGASRGHVELVLESEDPRAYVGYLRGFDELWDADRGR